MKVVTRALRPLLIAAVALTALAAVGTAVTSGDDAARPLAGIRKY